MCQRYFLCSEDCRCVKYNKSFNKKIINWIREAFNNEEVVHLESVKFENRLVDHKNRKIINFQNTGNSKMN